MRRTDPNGNPLSGSTRPKPKTDKPRFQLKVDGFAEWSSVDPLLLARVVVAVTKAGDAIRFGYTSDGGALVLAIISDPQTPTMYFKPSDDVEHTFNEILVAYES